MFSCETVTEDILKNSCSENCFNLSQNKELCTWDMPLEYTKSSHIAKLQSLVTNVVPRQWASLF